MAGTAAAACALAVLTFAFAAPAEAFDRAPTKKRGLAERPAYDRKLEEAAIRIVAGRIGALRGPIGETDLVPLVEAVRAAGQDRAPGYTILAGRTN